MNKFLTKNWLTVMGIALGAAGGYVYYYLWGCTNGCPIKSSSWKMVLYGMLIGGLLLNMVQDEVVKRRK